MSDLISAVAYEVSYWAIFFFFTIGYRLRIYGLRHVPRRGPVLVIANHQSLLDPPAIGLGIPRHIHYLAKKALFRNPIFGLWLRTVRAVPIDQEGVGKEGMRNILTSLSGGNVVMVFPEGQRTPDGRFQELRPGVGLLINRVRAPILPAAIVGAYDAWPRTRKLPVLSPLFLPWSRRSLTVVYGPPRDPVTLDGLSRAEMLTVLHDDIAAALKEAEARRKAAGGTRIMQPADG